jgi:hypothetical protein
LEKVHAADKEVDALKVAIQKKVKVLQNALEIEEIQI